MHSVGLVLHPQRDPAEAVDAVLGWAARKEIAVFGIKDEIRRVNPAVVPVTAGELGRRCDLVTASAETGPCYGPCGWPAGSTPRSSA
jgi:NAD+ kinase